MGWLSSFFSNPWTAMTDIPGSPEAVTQSVIDGSGSDGLSWNPFYQEGPSVWDRGALGYNLSDQNQEREHGRMLGRAIAGYATGGYSEVPLSAMQTKAYGGSNKDALFAAGKAATLAGANSYLGGLDAAGSMGIENPIYRGAVNGALSSGTTAALGGADSTQIGRSLVKGGIGGGLDGYRGGNMDYEEGGYSRAPWAQTRDTSMFVDGAGGQSLPVNYNPSSSGWGGFSANPEQNKPQETLNPFSGYMDKLLGGFKTNDQWDGKKIGSFGEGLMGLYGGWKQRQMAQQMMRGLGGRRNDYETNLRNELIRKDAAAGRRSNYDGRAVQLNASLANLDAQQMPMVSQLQNSSLSGLFNMLKSGYSTAHGMGLFNAPPQAGPGLQSQTQYTPSSALNISNSGGESPYSLSTGLNKNRKLFGG